MRLNLARSPEIKDKVIPMGTHPMTGARDHMLRYGAFKGYMDGLMGSHGALLREPYADKPETSGHYRAHSSDDPPGYEEPNLEKIYQLMKTAVEAGYIIDTHAIGDKGIDLVLDAYERLAKETTPGGVARSRVIHAQTIHDDMIPRFQALDVIAETTPSNLQDDMRWIVRRLGPEREKLSHRYGSFVHNEVVAIGGSDIPGAQGATFECHPRSMIHAVVNRTQDDGTPAGGWYPDEKLTMHEAIKMYTWDAAYAVFDEDVRGSIKPGKLADLTICDRNLMTIDPADALKMNIEMTVVDGRIVFERQ
jgi:predicted amidohydrolase YtcJ